MEASGLHKRSNSFRFKISLIYFKRLSTIQNPIPDNKAVKPPIAIAMPISPKAIVEISNDIIPNISKVIAMNFIVITSFVTVVIM